MNVITSVSNELMVNILAIVKNEVCEMFRSLSSTEA